MMNTLSRSVMTLYAYDHNADDTFLPNVLRQCLNLIRFFRCCRSTVIRHIIIILKKKVCISINPDPKFSVAENILLMLRPDIVICNVRGNDSGSCTGAAYGAWWW